MMGASVESVSEIPCGNTVGLIGIDKYLVKSGTISTHSEAHNIRPMKYSVAPVVRVAVKPKNVVELPKLIDGLRNLAKDDPVVQCYTEATGEHIVGRIAQLRPPSADNDWTESHRLSPRYQLPRRWLVRQGIPASAPCSLRGRVRSGRHA